MNGDTLKNLLSLIASDNDQDALMGLRALQALVREQGVDFPLAVTAMLAGLPALQAQSAAHNRSADTVTPSAPSVPSGTGMGATSCYVAGANILALTSAALPQAVRINLPESMAGSAGILAESLKDAVVAAEINRCRMKLKLYDIKNTRGEVVETQVRAEYARTGMVPLIIWTAVNRGDAAALTAVLRPALTMALPQLFG